MAQVIGYIKSLQNGIFFAKDAHGEIRELKAGDQIFKDELVYGAPTNSQNAHVIIDVTLTDAKDITLSGAEQLYTDLSVIGGTFEKEDAVVSTDAVENAWKLSTNTSTPDTTTPLDATAAGVEAPAAGQTTADGDHPYSGTFYDRTAGLGDVRTVLHDSVNGGTSQNITAVDNPNLNDQPVVANVTGTVNEALNGLNQISGQLVATDPDVGDTHTFFAVSGTLLLNGQPAPEGIVFVMNQDGTYSVTGDFNALAAGEKAVISFQYYAVDNGIEAGAPHASLPATVTLTIVGTNDQPVVSDVSVTQAEVLDGVNTFAGKLSVSDADASDTHTFQVVDNSLHVNANVELATPTLVLNPDGTYSISGDFNALAAGETATVTFQYYAVDSSSNQINGESNTSEAKTVTLTITGTNDAPVLVSNDPMAFSVHEDVAIANLTPPYNGSIDISKVATDVDNGDTLHISKVDGHLVDTKSGYTDTVTFSYVVNGITETIKADVNVNQDGTYVISNAGDLNPIPAGVNATATLTFNIADEHGAETAAKTVNLTIVGTNDAPVISAGGDVKGDAVEAGVVTQNGVTTPVEAVIAHGALSATDVDNGATQKWSAGTSQEGTNYGTFAIDAKGNWIYTAGDAANQLAEGETKTETFKVTVTDDKGAIATQDVVITIHGTNDVPDATNDMYVISDLRGQYYAYNEGALLDGANLTNLAQVEKFIATHTADATFAAKAIDFNYIAANGLGGDGNLQKFLGTEATSTLSRDPENSSDAIVKLSGSVELAAGDYTFRVTSDDGFSIVIDGKTVATDDSIHSPRTKDYTVFISESGTHNISVVYWDQGGEAVLKVEVKNNATDSSFHVLTGASDALSNLVTNEDTPLTIAPSILLANDSDVDGDKLTITNVQGDAATHGTVALVNGNVVYTPEKDFNGDATFKYTVSDGNGATDTATVTLHVNPVNDAPVLKSTDSLQFSVSEDNATLPINTSGKVTLSDLATDVDGTTLHVSQVNGHSVDAAKGYDTPLTFTYLDKDGHPAGTVNATVHIGQDGSYKIDYVNGLDGIPEGVKATANLSFTIADEHGAETSAKPVTVTIIGNNDAPVAVADTLSATEDTPIIFKASDLLGNDTDVDTAHSALKIASVASGDNGTAVLNADGTVSFTPNANFSGDAHFTYTTTDGVNGTHGVLVSNAATATVTVAPVADAPTLLMALKYTDTVAATSQTIDVNNVASSGKGFSVSCLNADGVTKGALSIVSSGTNHDGFGVQGSASGADEELGNNGKSSEIIIVKFDHAIQSVEVAFAWLNSGETAKYDFYSNGILVGSSSNKGITDTIDPSMTLSAGKNIAFDEIRFSAPGAGDDYLINKIVFPVTDTAYHYDFSVHAALTDTSETLGHVLIPVSSLGSTTSLSGTGVTLVGDHYEIAVTNDTDSHVTLTSNHQLNVSEINTISGSVTSTDGTSIATTTVTAFNEVAGTSGNDTALNGTSGNDKIDGGAGNDKIDGGAGNDKIDGGAGNDTLVYDSADSKIDGGAGTDTLQITSNTTIDFGALDNSIIKNIEVLDLTQTNVNVTLTKLSLNDVIDMTDNNHTLTILGDSADKVTVDSTLTKTGTTSTEVVNGVAHTFDVYAGATDPTVIVKIEQTIQHS